MLTTLHRHDPAYPVRLGEIKHPPMVLYVQGELRAEDGDGVAIVGTRKPGNAAAKLTLALSYDLAERGFTIVSGLALGIDTQAHRGALQTRCGRTLAVSGSGLDTLHPPSNHALAQQISQRGALLSEHPAGTPLTAQHLVARNRLISGLSRAVIVIETATDGGAMYCAEFARQQHRLLFAVPGSSGCDTLIANGAISLDPTSLDMDYLALQIRTYTPPARPTQLGLDF